jgi:hypothetical protein
MQKVDLNFPVTHPQINRELYQRLRWSYDSLPDVNSKNCFLYCAMLSEDVVILLEMMVQVWISEGLVKAKEDADYDYVLKTGESYLKLLENRFLFQVKGGVTYPFESKTQRRSPPGMNSVINFFVFIFHSYVSFLLIFSFFMVYFCLFSFNTIL